MRGRAAMYAPPAHLQPPLRVEFATTGRNDLVVCVVGELDLLTHGTLKSALDSLRTDEADVVRIRLDQLAFCDGRGLRMLLAFVRGGREAGQDVVIEEPSPIVQKLMLMLSPWALEPMAGSASGQIR